MVDIHERSWLTHLTTPVHAMPRMSKRSILAISTPGGVTIMWLSASAGSERPIPTFQKRISRTYPALTQQRFSRIRRKDTHVFSGSKLDVGLGELQLL